MPVIGTISSKNARLGIVYRNAENSENGVSNQPCLYAKIAAVNAIAAPTPTAIAVSSRCSIRRGSKRELKLSKNQLAQNW